LDELRFRALLLRAPELATARAFYCGAIGLRDTAADAPIVEAIDTAGARFYLEQVPPVPGPLPDQARATASFAVHDMTEAVTRLSLAGATFLQSAPVAAAAGTQIGFRDPFGNVHALVEPPAPARFDEPRVLQAGAKIPIASVPGAKRLYADTLGFVIASERRYPPLLPFDHPDGSRAFVIEDQEGQEPDLRVRAPLYPRETGVIMVLEAKNLEYWHAKLARRAPNARLFAPSRFAFGRRMAFIDSVGLAVEIWQSGT